MGHHNPPPSGPSILAGTLSFLQLMWDRPQIYPLWGPASILTHRLMSTHLRGTARRLTHRPVYGSDTICNAPDPPLANIVLFGLFLPGFPISTASRRILKPCPKRTIFARSRSGLLQFSSVVTLFFRLVRLTETC